MSDTTVNTPCAETRQSMLRVWMAISAVWVAFWLLIAAVVLATAAIGFPLGDQLRSFSLIVLAPPFAFLALGVIGRWIFVAFASRAIDIGKLK
jgi:hypothetical protein